MTEHQHKDSFGPPATGWPSFGPDGKVLRPPDDEETESNSDD